MKHHSLLTVPSSKIDPRYNLRWSPDGRTILVVGVGPENQPGAYAVDAQTGEVVASLPWAFWVEWSRDGKTVFYRHNDPNKAPLLVRDLKTGEDKELSRTPMGPIAVSPDGRWLAFSSSDNEARAHTEHHADDRRRTSRTASTETT